MTRAETMLKPKVNPINLAHLLADKKGDLLAITPERYEFWQSCVKNQIMFTLGDIGDDGYVVRDDGFQYHAFWFTEVRGSEGGCIYVHTAEPFSTPYEALEAVTDILKTDHEHEQQEALELMHRFADEVR